MFGKSRAQAAEAARIAELEAKVAAIGRSQAVIEFQLDGTILTANENFLAAVGYRSDEIEGRHHKIFVAPDYAGSAEYREFWAALSRANSSRASTSASARAAGRSGSRPATIRSSGRTESRTRSSSSPPT